MAAGTRVKLTVAVCPTETLVGCDCRQAESLGMHFNPVGSRVHLREEKAPLQVALDGADGAGVYLGCLDLGVGNRGAALVEDDAGECAAGSALRPKCRHYVNHG